MQARGHGAARAGLEPVPGAAQAQPARGGDAVDEPVPGAVHEAPPVDGPVASEVAADALRVGLVARQHGAGLGVEAVGHAPDRHRAARERAGARGVVPGAAVEDPAGRHGARGPEPVHGAVALVQARGHGAARAGLEPVPSATGVKPARMQRYRIERIRKIPTAVNQIPAHLPFNGP